LGDPRPDRTPALPAQDGPVCDHLQSIRPARLRPTDVRASRTCDVRGMGTSPSVRSVCPSWAIVGRDAAVLLPRPRLLPALSRASRFPQLLSDKADGHDVGVDARLGGV
jgi:hypothetical protein